MAGESRNVTQERSRIAGDVRSALSDLNVLAVDSPDHPLLLDAPDILVSTPGRLVALFLATKRETQRSNWLESRVILSRAVLPPHTVFLFGGDLPSRFKNPRVFKDVLPGLGLYNFEGYRSRRVKERDYKDLKLALLNGVDVSKEALVQRAEIHRRFSFVHRLSRYDLERTDSRGSKTISEISRERSSDSRYFKAFEKIPSPYHLRNVAYNGLDETGWLRADGDVVYAGSSEIGTLLAPKFPTFSGDPLKYERALAFSGWALADDETDVTRIERVTRVVARRRRG